ncbi:MFS transporter [Pluralibacter gergoviae]|nr:MFS transporter [Pluralibacter gergoviae]ELC3015828.1 MFS transporter [Pluralibacter gergoviae]ELC3020807.1 MFS transporter [Pluralibacter gergoviae]
MSLLHRLDRLPVSRPHYLLLLIGGLGYTFDGMDVAIIAFLLPALRDVWSLSGAELGIVGSATPIGVLIGALLAGYIGDRFGRKTVMCWALAIYCIMTLVAAFAPSFSVFVVARVLAGVGTGAESVIIAPFLSEFIPPKKRGWFIGSLAGFFSFGFVGAALLGRFVVPEFEDGWRYAQVVTALPILMLLWWRRSLPESPRYLLGKGRSDEARAIVERLEQQVITATGKALPTVARQPDAPRTPPAAATPGLLQSLMMMFGPAMRRQTTVIWVVWFVITFCYYGFFAWIPSLLVERGFTITRSFEFSIIIYIAQIPGYFSAAVCSDWLDRKRTIALYLAGSTVSAWCLSQADSAGAIVAAAAVLSFFLNGCYAGLYAYTPESFPTAIRATGCGFASAFGRIGSIMAPTIIGVFSASMGFAGVFVMTTSVLAAGIVVLLAWGVNTRGHALEAILPQAEAGELGRRERQVGEG